MNRTAVRHGPRGVVGLAVVGVYIACLVTSEFHALRLSAVDTRLLALPFLGVGLLIGTWWAPAVPALVWLPPARD